MSFLSFNCLPKWGQTNPTWSTVMSHKKELRWAAPAHTYILELWRAIGRVSHPARYTCTAADCCARLFRLSQGSKVHHSSLNISAETVCINFVQVVWKYSYSGKHCVLSEDSKHITVHRWMCATQYIPPNLLPNVNSHKNIWFIIVIDTCASPVSSCAVAALHSGTHWSTVKVCYIL